MKHYRILGVILVLVLVITVASIFGCVPAEGTEGEGEGGFASYAPIIILAVLMIAMFYFLMIRPMRQREQKHDELVRDLQKGDKVITAGGMYGEVDRVDEDSIVIIVESGAKIRVTKGGVLSRPDEQRPRY